MRAGVGGTYQHRARKARALAYSWTTFGAEIPRLENREDLQLRSGQAAGH
jgi:hypothetical protein